VPLLGATLKLNSSTSKHMLTTATRTVIEPSTTSTTVYSGAVVGHPEWVHNLYYTTLPKRTLFEEITPNSEGSHSSWKTFEHYKVSTGPPAKMSGLWDYSTLWINKPVVYCHTDPYFGQLAVNYGESGCETLGLPPFYSKIAGSGSFIPLPVKLEELKAMSLRTMLPAIKAELSLLNSVFELKDFKTLPRTLLKMKDLMERLGSRFKKDASLMRMLRGGADGYLQAQFNILPLLSDISGLRAALSRSERRINDLVNRSGRPQRRHFAYNWVEYTDSYERKGVNATIRPLVGPEVSHNRTQLYADRYVYNSSSIFHAEVEFNFNFTQYQLEHARALALLDAVGVNFNPAIIWNAIPWSFVVDWVAGVGRWLSQFTIAQMEPKINVRRYLWSVKRERRILVTRKLSWPVGFSPVPNITSVEVPLPMITETAYRRQVESLTSSSIILSGLSSKEFSLGAALVVSQRRRRK